MDIASCKLLGFSLMLFLSMANYCSASRVMPAPEAEGQGHNNEAIGEQGLDHTEEARASHAAGKEHGVVCYGTGGSGGWAGGGTSYSSGGGHGGGMAYGGGNAWAGYNGAGGLEAGGYGYGFGGGGGSHGGYAP